MLKANKIRTNDANYIQAALKAKHSALMPENLVAICQGDALSPIIFNACMYPIVQKLKTKFNFVVDYADDFTLIIDGTKDQAT